MYLSEEEARQKLCCNSTLINGKCVGSECMAWRGKEVLYDESNGEYKPDGMKKEYKRKYWKSFNLYNMGYCGLAGKPEE